MFDFTDVPDQQSFELLPKGSYKVSITDAKYDTNAKGNEFAKVTLTVTEGDYKGRKVFDQFMLKNANGPSADPKKDPTIIGLQRLKALWICCGKTSMKGELNEFLGCEVLASVKIQEAKDGYDASNKVSYYKPLPKQNTEVVPF
jgi:hypothetical protein